MILFTMSVGDKDVDLMINPDWSPLNLAVAHNIYKNPRPTTRNSFHYSVHCNFVCCIYWGVLRQLPARPDHRLGHVSQ